MPPQAPPLDLTRFSVLSFDCYGTMIDWESGIVAALGPWLDRHGAAVDRERLLEVFARLEAAQEVETPGLVYRELLGRVLARMGRELGLPVSAAEAAAFGGSVGAWPAFADSAATLAALGERYELVVLSNVDRRSFAATQERLGVAFDAVYTAEEIGTYKPERRNFEYLLARLAERGHPRERLLHVAQSLFHDHTPALALGIATCWIDRRAGREGWGATVPPPAGVEPDLRCTSLAELARLTATAWASGG